MPSVRKSVKPICPITGVTIPECSCLACLEALVRHHSPDLLEIRVSRTTNGTSTLKASEGESGPRRWRPRPAA